MVRIITLPARAVTGQTEGGGSLQQAFWETILVSVIFQSTPNFRAQTVPKSPEISRFQDFLAEINGIKPLTFPALNAGKPAGGGF